MTATGAQLSNAMRGFGVPDSRWTFSAIVTDSDDPPYSTFTQAGPRPGSGVCDSALSQLQVKASGEQDVEIVVNVTRAGMPDPPGGLRVGWREATVGTAYGWNPPNWLSHWDALKLDGGTYTLWGAALVPNTHDVAILYSDGTYLRYGRAVASSWALTGTTQIGAAPTGRAAIAILPNGRRIVYADDDVYYSDDGGTWTAYASDVLGTATPSGTTVRTRLVVCGNDLLLFIVTDTPAIYQYASRDGGASFQLRNTWTSDGLYAADICVTASGRVMAVGTGTATTLQAFTTGSPWVDISSATPVEVDPDDWSGTHEITAFVDFDGVVWVSLTYGGGVFLWGSYDEGATWTRCDYGPINTGDGSTYPTRMFPVPSAGGVVVPHQFVADPGTLDASICAMRWGGWSNLSGRVMEASRPDIGRGAWGVHATRTALTILPFDKHGDISTLTTTGAGTGTIDSTERAYKIVTAANALYHEKDGASDDVPCFGAELRVVSGGSSSSSDVAVTIQASDGVNAVQLRFRATTTDVYVQDGSSGAALHTLSYSSRIEFYAWANTDGSYFVSYRTTVDNEVIFGSVSATAGTLTSFASAVTRITYGHIASGTATSAWRRVVMHFHESNNWAASSLPGKALTSLPYPLNRITDSGGVTFIRALGGPGYYNENHTITPRYDYGIENLFWQESPSPQQVWRSTTDAADVEIVFNLQNDKDTRIGDAPFIALLNCNFRNALVEGWDGADWNTVIEYDSASDLGTSLTSDNDADGVAPAAGTGSAGRYIQAGEFAGASICTDGSVVVEIREHTEGVWAGTANTNAKRARFYVGDDAVSVGAGAYLIPRNALAIGAANVAYQRYRLRILAQPTAQGYFECGLALVGDAKPIGRQWSLARSQETAQNLDRQRDGRGTVRARRLGPSPTSWTLSWADDLNDLREIRGDVDLDYLAINGAIPLANENDVSMKLRGILEVDLEGGVVPVAAIANIEEGTTSDRTMFLYGTWASSLDVQIPLGNEGDSEATRIGPILIEGQP